MNEEPEIIDSSEMEILNQFLIEYENDEEITKPESTEKAELYICSLDKDIIIAYRSKRSGRRISEIVVEKTKHIICCREH